MKKVKRILALVGAILLFGMYASTLVFALIDHSSTMGLLKASIACTIIRPVLLYAYTLVYKIAKGSDKPGDDISDAETLGQDDETFRKNHKSS